MNETTVLLLIIIGLIILVILYKWLKPYVLRYNTTICITGELGAGKTLTGVKLTRVLIRKARLKVAFYNKYKLPVINKIRSWKIKRANKKFIKHKISEKQLLLIKQNNEPKTKKRKPQVFSTTPVCLNARRLFKQKKPEYSVQLKLEHMLLIERMPEYSVIFIDEMPQFVNQFNWDEELVQQKLNEMITFARHYIDPHIIITAQSVMDVVVQIRRKINHATWAYGFKKHLFGLFYTIRMCDIMVNDAIQTFSTTYMEENTKLHFGLFPPKGTYDTRCYSDRYKNCLDDPQHWVRYKQLKTNTVLRIEKYISPIDDKTTKEQKENIKKELIKRSNQ